jgi:hypothetical protein
LRCLASGLGREDRNQMPPRRTPPDGDFDRRVGNEREARQTKDAPSQTQNHGRTVANLTDSNEFSAET